MVAAIDCNLPLVISNQSELGQLAQIFLQRENLANAPLLSEGLAGRYFAELPRYRTRDCFLAVDFPVGGEVCGGPLILGDVKRGARRDVVTPIPGTHIVTGP